MKIPADDCNGGRASLSSTPLDEIARFDPTVPIERAWMPPSSWYTSADIASLEADRVFARHWLPIARSEELAEVGSAISGCVAGEPWLLVRDRDNIVRAFHNTCRHKGNVLVAESGSRGEELVCGYHGWAYALDGRLLRAPRVAGIEDFDRDAMSLVPLALASWGPWLFICSDPAKSWPTGLGPLTEALDSTDWDQLRYVRSASWELKCNWKVYVDNYLDGGYHIGTIHPSLAEQLDETGYQTTLGDGFSLQRAPASDSGGERIGGGAHYAFVYPNFMVNRYGDCLEGNIVVPLGPDRCRVDYDFFFAEGTAEQAIESSVAESVVIQDQDVAVSEAVQRGLSSRGFDRGRYAPRVEQAEHHFHCTLARDLRNP